MLDNEDFEEQEEYESQVIHMTQPFKKPQNFISSLAIKEGQSI